MDHASAKNPNTAAQTKRIITAPPFLDRPCLRTP
jgi:hypothetical protein